MKDALIMIGGALVAMGFLIIGYLWGWLDRGKEDRL